MLDVALFYKKCVDIPNGLLEAINRRTDTTRVKRRKPNDDLQNITQKLQIEQHDRSCIFKNTCSSTQKPRFPICCGQVIGTSYHGRTTLLYLKNKNAST